MEKVPEAHDLIIIGGGPAGLSAAITAESERIDTLVLDSSPKLGGQAGTSSFIENYPGFPNGISGVDLMSNFVDQALRFNTEFMGPVRAMNIKETEGGLIVVADDGEEFFGGAVLLTAGVEYRKLRARNLSAYLGRGAAYGSPNPSRIFEGGKIYVVGGANSAGQAAYHLATSETCEVNVIIRGNSIENGMSGYLVDKIATKPNIIVRTGSELVGVDGNGRLDRVTVRTLDGEAEEEATDLFVMIGSEPKTGWLPEVVLRDEKGFVISGGDLSEQARQDFNTKAGRSPLPHETSMPGLFVAGDVRCGTNKRVALAAGDGAGVIPEIHRLRALQSRK